jgi:hypothetical protein
MNLDVQVLDSLTSYTAVRRIADSEITVLTVSGANTSDDRVIHR